uniref:IclR family transcriptional regulator n=1 Tax=Thaumasiovibrio occultus TaxID=1891184 RepID=UPI000B34C815|nr:IclR family transcriptional regulator [Thaumasiovibrio occultus]
MTMNQTNEKLLQILMQVAANPEPLNARELSELLELPLSSMYRYLKLLREWGLVEERNEDKSLIVGPAALMLQRGFNFRTPNMQYIDTVLARLQRQTGELAAYMVPVGYRAMCVAQKESDQALRCSFVPGQSQPLLRGASSKAMLAFMSEARYEKILAHFNELDNLAEWQEEFTLIRYQGYAISDSEIDPGVSGVSAPVMRGTKMVGAVSVMAPTSRIAKNKQAIIYHVLEAARALPTEI